MTHGKISVNDLTKADVPMGLHADLNIGVNIARSSDMVFMSVENLSKIEQ